MTWIRSLTTSIVLVAFFCFMLPRQVYAYLDPGSVSYMLQLLLASLVGALFATKIVWTKIKIFFKNLRTDQKQSGNKHDDEK